MNNSQFKLYLIITLVVSGLLPVAGSTFLHISLSGSYWINIQLHSVVEAMGSFTALSLAVLILLLKKDKRISSYYIWVSCALIAMGILDVFHAFISPDNSFVWLHSMAVLAGGFLFAMVWLPDNITQSRPSNALNIVVAAAIVILSAFAVYSPDMLPAMINGNIFTPVADEINMLGGLFFLSAAAYFIIRYRSNQNHEDFLFINFCLLNGWAGLLFQFSQIWHADWWFWHLLRLVAYLIVLSFMFITFQHSEEELKQHREHLEELVQKRTAELKITNEQLQQEIGERRRVEEKLRESEKKYRVLFDAAPVGIGIADLEGNIVDGNLGMQEMTGFTLEELKSTDVGSTYVDPNERKSLLNALQETGRVRDWEIRLKHKDKTIYYALLNVDLLEFGENKVLLTIARDITERKRAEKEKDRFLKAFASSTDGITIADENDRFIYVNEAYAKIFSCYPEELIGNTWRKITPPEMIASTETGLSSTMHNKDIGIFYGEVPGFRKDGTIIPTEVRGTGLWDEDGNYQGHICIVRDITERKQTEEKLRSAHKELEMRVQERTAKLAKANEALQAEIIERKRAEEKIREQAALLDKAHDAIGVRNLEHNLIYWNKGAERLYGWTAEEVIGKNPVEFLFKDKEEPPQLIEAKKSVLEKGEWTGELRHMTKDGRELIVESRWTLVQDGEGKPKSILIINTDITEKKNLESQFLRAQRMESIGTLAGGIAHDINNVLTPMMLSLQLLQEKFTDIESQKLLEVLERSTQRGANLVKQIQSFARGMRGERVALQVSHLIYEIVHMAKETFPRSIDIRTDIQKDLWTTSGDATQLHQVIMNICVNARDAMPDGGTLSISAGNIFIDESYARMNIEARVGPYVVITISDTGTGIPPKIMDRIFDPFFTTKQPGKGTGIGLSTALTIVKSHGGFINVYSEVGEGTVFKIHLPVTKTTELQKGDKQLELPAGHGESILVVDDEPRVLEITKSILKTHGYRVITANDGKEAISLCSQHNGEIKVVLMDMMMPVMDGPASIRELRKVNPDIKIIGVSGLTEKDKLAKVADVHVHAFLTKPYTAEKLLKNIHAILRP